MIHLDNISFRYQGVEVLHNITSTIKSGEIVLLKGSTGSGKSTLLGLIAGQSPTFTGGHLQGSISIDGILQSTATSREWARLVGFVQQSPRHGFVGGSVEDEIVFGMENFGIPPVDMRHRLEELLDTFALRDLRYKPMQNLSAGQQQLVAIAAAVAVRPRVLLLDEPTSALDADSTARVLNVVQTLAREEGLAVLVAEHRVERLSSLCDYVIELPLPGDKLSEVPLVLPTWKVSSRPHISVDVVVEVNRLGVTLGGVEILRNVSLQVESGHCAAITGENGVGKSTLMRVLMGDLACDSGSVQVCGLDPAELTAILLAKKVNFVPQQPSDLFLFESVHKECALNDRVHELDEGSTLTLLHSLTPHVTATQHPRELSEGQQLLLALALTFSGTARVILLDEPTRGLDVHAKRLLTQLINHEVSRGRSIIISTHDTEFAHSVTNDVVLLETTMSGAR